MGTAATEARVIQERDWGPGGFTRIAGESFPGVTSGGGGISLNDTALRR